MASTRSSVHPCDGCGTEVDAEGYDKHDQKHVCRRTPDFEGSVGVDTNDRQCPGCGKIHGRYGYCGICKPRREA